MLTTTITAIILTLLPPPNDTHNQSQVPTKSYYHHLITTTTYTIHPQTLPNHPHNYNPHYTQRFPCAMRCLIILMMLSVAVTWLPTSQCNCFGNVCLYDLKLQLGSHSVDHFKAIFHVDVECVLLRAKVCQSL